MTMHRPILITLALTLACTSVPAADDEAGTTTSPSSTAEADADVTTSDDESTATTSDDDPTVGTSTSSSTDDAETFIPLPDTWEDLSCDAFFQDCPEGEKCVAYASSGGAWDALKCVPVQGNQAAGDPCTSSGVVESTDDCDATSWCWNVDENGEGICHSFCTGTPDMPVCPPMSQCSISGRGVVNICIPNCDPTLQNCSIGTACYWTGVDFICASTTEDIPAGEACGFVNDCAMGNICIDAESVPPCNGPSCCASFCDLDLGNAQCADVPGTVCASFFEQGEAPPEYAHVGICILPP